PPQRTQLQFITIIFHFTRAISPEAPFIQHRFSAIRDLHSFPPRRSSDLQSGTGRLGAEPPRGAGDRLSLSGDVRLIRQRDSVGLDRKSTRLNSSHVSISYAVFCLKKKKCDRYRREDYEATCSQVLSDVSG